MNNKLSAVKIKSFQASIGRFVLEWAGLEVGIDLLVMIVARALGSADLPHEISKKLTRIEVNAARLNMLSSDTHHLLSLIKEVRSLAPIRHDYVHGAIINHVVAKSELTVTLARLLQPRKAERRMPAAVTEEKLEKMSDRFHQIGNEMLDLAEIANRLNPTK